MYWYAWWWSVRTATCTVIDTSNRELLCTATTHSVTLKTVSGNVTSLDTAVDSQNAEGGILKSERRQIICLVTLIQNDCTSKNNFLNNTLFSCIAISTQRCGDECQQNVWKDTLRPIWLNHNTCLGVYSATHALPIIYHVHSRHVAVNTECRWQDNSGEALSTWRKTCRSVTTFKTHGTCNVS
jgi:hypothetical protein